MRFNTVNDLKTICLDEARLVSIKLGGGQLVICAEGAVIRSDNPNNTRFEDMYCVLLELVLDQVEMKSFCLQGYKYYDADGRLMNQIPSRPLSGEEQQKAMIAGDDAWIFRLEEDPAAQIYRLIYDKEDEGQVRTYELEFTFNGSRASWERFSGPVEG